MIDDHEDQPFYSPLVVAIGGIISEDVAGNNIRWAGDFLGRRSSHEV